MQEFRHCPLCGAMLRDVRMEGRPRRACADPDCGYVFYDTPLPVVAALIEYDGFVILARNRSWPENMFGLITGFLERGESPEAGVLREVREELGLEGQLAGLIGIYPFERNNELILAYHVRAHGDIRPGEEIAEYRLIAPDRLRPWPFGTGFAVRDWLLSRGVAIRES